MNRFLKRHCIHLVFLAAGLSACGGPPTPTVSGGEESVDASGLLEALDNCEEGIPCPIVTYAYANCLDLVPVVPERPLGVFDAQQGGVATWVTLVIANAPEEHPYIQLEVLTEDGPLNYKEKNGPKTLKVPFLPLNDSGIRYQDQYMIPFDAVCCASDYEGREATLRLTVSYADLDPVTREWPIVLGENPWPLDEESASLEQCTCAAWPAGLPKDPAICE